MKRRTMVVLSGLFLISVLAAASSVQAQSGSSMRVDIPFDFAVGNKTYQSGVYSVEASSTVIRLESKVGNNTAFVTSTIPLRSAGDRDLTQLEFRRYGDQYFLHKVWMGAEGYELPKTKLEREVIVNRSTASADIQIETIIVTAN